MLGPRMSFKVSGKTEPKILPDPALREEITHTHDGGKVQGFAHALVRPRREVIAEHQLPLTTCTRCLSRKTSGVMYRERLEVLWSRQKSRTDSCSACLRMHLQCLRCPPNHLMCVWEIMTRTRRNKRPSECATYCKSIRMLDWEANLEQVLLCELLPFDRAFWGGRRSREEAKAGLFDRAGYTVNGACICSIIMCHHYV